MPLKVPDKGIAHCCPVHLSADVLAVSCFATSSRQPFSRKDSVCTSIPHQEVEIQIRSDLTFTADIILDRERHKSEKERKEKKRKQETSQTKTTDQHPNRNPQSAAVQSPPGTSDTDIPSHHSPPRSYTAPGSSTLDNSTSPPPRYSNSYNYIL